MPEILKPNFNNGLWASGGAIVAPSDVKIATGWTAEVPPFQWENYSQNRQDQGIAHILQHGISVWDSLTEYQAGKSFVQGANGKVYVALTTNTNQNPTTDTLEVNWSDIFKSNEVLFTTPGTSSWTVPLVLRLGLKKATVTVIGGGGGGGGIQSTVSGAAGGGGGGGGARSIVDLTGVTTVSMTVGAGGAGGQLSNGWNGLPGGTTLFGAFVVANGGSGGNGAGSQTVAIVLSGASGGVGTTGTIKARGNGGTDGTLVGITSSGGAYGGNGGGGAFIGGGADGGVGAGSNGLVPGDGGSGAAVTNNALQGGNGFAGSIYIEW